MDENARKKRINDVICKITGAKEARQGQVEAVYRLVHQQKDTVLVAATGYGKSAVLYAFSALTILTTVQIVPLTKLGENQRDDIARAVPSSKPIWIDSNTHLKNPNVWNKVKAGQYSHVLLSPEQAVNPKFKAVLRDPDFHSKLGLFAIDELHMISEWREFREEFTYLHTLRALIPKRIPFFSYTATLDKDNQAYILKHAGFDQRNLRIIRTSIDRPEITVILLPLMRKLILARYILLKYL
ncbi:hypothetical protein B0T24DRAFT_689826 [Lasiosphaeria ovina]|uniref:DNA 3'-5' helicase n=1 Tax=Lasiosphaeria ovina TaxID=92902 RepID=A0AAE0TYW9_9PEZI|nr:hypothetical protein B0T24DRAFT_689826 [Lasiosphaeria ovina]